jgi:hypothetical protein
MELTSRSDVCASAGDGLTVNPMRGADTDEEKTQNADGAQGGGASQDNSGMARQRWNSIRRSIVPDAGSATADVLIRTSFGAATATSEGKMYFLQARQIRKNFLMYSLALVAIIVVVLAGFGTLAAQDSQLQTVQYLGTMLLRSVAADLEWLIEFTEREVATFAINTPPFSAETTDNSTSVSTTETSHVVEAGSVWAAQTMTMIFALLDSAKRTGLPSSGLNDDDDNATSATTAQSKKSHLLWQMYYARPDGTVLGVSQFSAPSAAHAKDVSWQCWGGTNGTHVRRTYASAQCGWDQLRSPSTSHYAYDYDARSRPWYALAMNSPGNIVWTKPYRFKATGYLGLTAAVATRIGGGLRPPPTSSASYPYDANTVGVFAVDITLTGLETFMGKLAEEVQTKGGFASFPADIAILYEDFDLAFSEVISSSEDAREKLLQLTEKFELEGTTIDAEARTIMGKNVKTGRPVSVELCNNNASTCSNWLVFADTFRGFETSASTKVKISLVALIRRSNFLAALELASRTFYPFIAAVLVMLTVVASNVVTRQILRKFTHRLNSTKKTDSDDPPPQPHARCKSSRRCLAVVHDTVKRFSHRQRYFLHPFAVCIVVAAIVHSLLNFGGQIALAAILVINKVALGAILHSIFLDAGFSIGFYQESWKAASRLSFVLIGVWLVLIVVEVALAPGGLVADAGTMAIATTVSSVVRRCYEFVMILAYVVFVVRRKPGEALSSEETSRKRWRFRVSVFLVLVLGTSFHIMAAFGAAAIGDLPHYTLPAVASIVLLISAAHFDRPVRKTWPRPRILDYTLVLSLSFLWILPWILDVFSAFTQGLNTSSQFEGLGGFSIGFTLSLSWTLVSIVISVFFQYFQETAVSDGLGVSIHFGTCLFRSLVGSLLFLVVEPLDIYFYILVLADTGVFVLLGLGVRHRVWDRFCSKAAWRQNVDTHTKKEVRRAMFTQFGSIASMNAKAVMIVVVILDMIFVSFEVEGGGRDTVKTVDSNSSETSSIYATPALTGKMHRLERWAMLSGFVVQFSFNFMGNDLVERYISYRIAKLARMLFATQVFRSDPSTNCSIRYKSRHTAESLRRQNSGAGSVFSLQVQQPNSSRDNAKQVLRDVTRETGGLGEEVLFLKAGGKKMNYSFTKHRDAVFKAKSSIILIWSMYMTSELILRFYVSRKPAV